MGFGKSRYCISEDDKKPITCDQYRETAYFDKIGDDNTNGLTMTEQLNPSKMPSIKTYDELVQKLNEAVPVFDIPKFNTAYYPFLGRGSYGEVIKYTPRNNIMDKSKSKKLKKGVPYAVKITRLENPTNFKHFYMETISLYNIKSEFVIKFIGVIYDVYVNSVYSIYEFCDGIDLTLDFKNKIPVDKLILQIAKGIKDIHDAGIAHQDLNPANIMLCRSNSNNSYNVKIIDFGLSHIATNNNISQRTGTMNYMAPELFHRLDKYFPLALSLLKQKQNILKRDIYSFGIILNQLEITNQQQSTNLIIPYENVINRNDDIAQKKIFDGERPTHCKSSIYADLIQECWNKRIKKRPTAEKLVAEI